MSKRHEGQDLSRTVERLARRNRQYLVGIWAMGAFSVLVVLGSVWSLYEDDIRSYIYSAHPAPPPHEQAVRHLFADLEYNSLDTLEREDAHIILDFENESWTLANRFRFDEQGHVILEKGHRGQCSALALYAYDKLKDVFAGQYQTDILLVQESEYFPPPASSHFVISVEGGPGLLGRRYLIDPSYKRYGSVEEFENYVPVEVVDAEDLRRRMMANQYLPISNYLVLMLKKPFVFYFFVGAMGDQYDENNYALVLSARKQYKYVTRYVYAIRRVGGKVNVVENKEAFQGVLSNAEYKRLVAAMDKLFYDIRFKGQPQ